VPSRNIPTRISGGYRVVDASIDAPRNNASMPPSENCPMMSHAESVDGSLESGPSRHRVIRKYRMMNEKAYFEKTKKKKKKKWKI
jgi:hypothetical protein